MTVTIEHRDWEGSDDDRFYIFTDVAELFWPDDYGHSNHAAQDKITEKMAERGCTRLAGYCEYQTPHGIVNFDSESGMFECHSNEVWAVIYVKGIIEEIRAELDAHREALQ